MARPKKTGLDYFPLDVNVFEDEKISAISGEFGLKGEVVVIKLLCAIFKNGYFAVWNKLTQMKLAKDLQGMSPDLLNEIVHRLVAYDFFDKGLFDSMEPILTSVGIQKRYFEAIKRRDVSGADFPYLLLETPSTRVNVYKNPHSTELMPTFIPKVKESKVKESSVCVTHTQEDIFFLKVKNWLSENAPNVLKFEEPLTPEQYRQIWELCGKDGELVKRLFKEMHNNAAHRKKSSALLTFESYFANDNQRSFTQGRKVAQKELTYAEMQAKCSASYSQENFTRLPNGNWIEKRNTN